QKMLIDSTKPIVRITTAQRTGDEIAVAWDITEANPDLASLRLEYRTKDTQWKAVPLNPSLKGDTRFAPGTPATVELRMQIKDMAGNIGFAPAEVMGATTVATNAAPPPSAPGSGLPASAPPIAPPLAPPPAVIPPAI